MGRKKKDRTIDACGILDVKCHTCGKAFATSPAYSYYRRLGDKGRRLWFCKYTCMTAYDRSVAEKKSAARKRKTSDAALERARGYKGV